MGATSVAVATTHVAYSRMAVTDVLLTLAVTCVLALAIEGRIEWAGLAVGLAASAKYPGALDCVAGRGRRVGAVACARSRGRARRCRFRPDEPVRAHPRRSGVGRHLARAAPCPGGLARIRERPDRASGLPRPTLGGARAAPHRGGSSASPRHCAAGAASTSSCSPSSVVYWLTLMPQHAHFDRYVLPLVPVLARPRRKHAEGGSDRARRARRSARVVCR